MSRIARARVADARRAATRRDRAPLARYGVAASSYATGILGRPRLVSRQRRHGRGYEVKSDRLLGLMPVAFCRQKPRNGFRQRQISQFGGSAQGLGGAVKKPIRERIG